MRWVLIIGAGLVAIVVIVTIVGALLPRDHVASTTATINVPPDSIWRVISDPSSGATWRDLQKVEMVHVGNAVRWREHSKMGTVTFEQVDAVRPSKFVSRIADTDQGFGGTWTISLAPEGTGTGVTIREEGFVSNPIFRFMSRFIFGQYGTQEDYLRAPGRKFGQPVTPTRL